MLYEDPPPLKSMSFSIDSVLYSLSEGDDNTLLQRQKSHVFGLGNRVRDDAQKDALWKWALYWLEFSEEATRRLANMGARNEETEALAKKRMDAKDKEIESLERKLRDLQHRTFTPTEHSSSSRDNAFKDSSDSSSSSNALGKQQTTINNELLGRVELLEAFVKNCTGFGPSIQQTVILR